MKAFVGASFVTAASAIDFGEFKDFKNHFQKSYANGEEESYRKGIFDTNVEFIKNENARQSEYELGVNQFADLLVHEWTAQYFGMARPEKPFGDVPYLGRHQVGNETLPGSVDWTTKGAVTPVKNQGQCGSCWSFSATGAMEGAYEIATGSLVSISEQQLVDCAQAEGEQGCNGGLMDGAFTYAKKTGMCTEASYPYKAKGGTCKASSCTKAFDAGVVTGYKDVTTDNEQALMSAVAQQPTSIAIEADKSVFQLYKSGVLSGMCGSKLDHGVLAVGYGTASNGGDYWKVKNSWAATWGDKGYVLLKRGKGGAGECGLLSGPPSYPIVSGQPGPAPPSPPSPPAPPSPPSPPSPGTTHYEKPPCQSDEVAVQVQGADGETCAAHCDTTACPTDIPPGTTAKPNCALQDSSSGAKYCALTCFLGGCPTGAKCAMIGGIQGICLYPTSTAPHDYKLAKPAQSEITV